MLSEKPRLRIRNSNDGKRAYFDAAATTRHNSNHWAYATEHDINTLIRGDLATLRKRARFEILNNGYGAGIADTLAFDVVGPDGTLRPQFDSGNTKFNSEAEDKFLIWAQTCDYTEQMGLGEFLQMQLVLQLCEAGESVTIKKRDQRSGNYDVSLRLLAIETERLDNPLDSAAPSARMHDGIEFDTEGRPSAYYILKDHPNGSYAESLFDYDRVPAHDVIHLFRVKRPGQSRGIPWFAPALPLFADMRRFTLATLEGAETAANNAGVMKSMYPPETGDEEDVESNDVIELERNALLTLPVGWDITQIKPEHPATTYAMFKGEILNEIARGVMMPYNVAAANSSDYNYASGRLDHQKYHRFIKCIRGWASQRFLRPVVSAWMTEAFLIPGYFKTQPTFEQAMLAVQTAQWFWSGFEHVDPVKEAQAERIRLESGTATLKDVFAEQGHDWEKKIEQRGREIEKMKKLGIPVPTSKNLKIEDDDDESTPSKQKNQSQKK